VSEFAAQAAQAAADIGAAAGRVDPAALQGLVQEIAAARQIVLQGAGREGLMMRGLAMRLAHLGCRVHMAGDMATPPVGPGDLLLVSSGPGALASIAALIGVAKAAGARTILNPAPASNLTAYDLSAIDYLTPNETEARVCLGLDPAAVQWKSDPHYTTDPGEIEKLFNA